MPPQGRLLLPESGGVLENLDQAQRAFELLSILRDLFLGRERVGHGQLHAARSGECRGLCRIGIGGGLVTGADQCRVRITLEQSAEIVVGRQQVEQLVDHLGAQWRRTGSILVGQGGFP